LEPVAGLVTQHADLQGARAAFEELQAQFSPPPDTHVRPVTAGGISSLLVSPAEDTPATVLYLHGGGYVLGSAFGYQPHAGALAAAAQTGVLVPEYRLAPEHPFPAAVEDSLRAYQWLIELGTTPEHVTIAADSSGCGLMLSMLLTLKQKRAPLPGATVLFCPWVTLAPRPDGPSSDTAAVPTAIDGAFRCAAAYLAGHPHDDPVVDPLSADLAGLPRMLIQAATGDAQLADAKALAAHAQSHEVDVRLELFPVDAHAFQLFWSFLPEAADAIEAAGVFITRQSRSAEHLAGAGSANAKSPGAR
jgi:epsilon-lactone hydrolase